MLISFRRLFILFFVLFIKILFAERKIPKIEIIVSDEYDSESNYVFIEEEDIKKLITFRKEEIEIYNAFVYAYLDSYILPGEYFFTDRINSYLTEKGIFWEKDINKYGWNYKFYFVPEIFKIAIKIFDNLLILYSWNQDVFKEFTKICFKNKQDKDYFVRNLSVLKKLLSLKLCIRKFGLKNENRLYVSEPISISNDTRTVASILFKIFFMEKKENIEDLFFTFEQL